MWFHSYLTTQIGDYGALTNIINSCNFLEELFNWSISTFSGIPYQQLWSWTICQVHLSSLTVFVKRVNVSYRVLASTANYVVQQIKLPYVTT